MILVYVATRQQHRENRRNDRYFVTAGMTIILCPRLFTGLRVTSYRVSNLCQVGSGHGPVCQTSSLTRFSSEFHCAHLPQYCFCLQQKHLLRRQPVQLSETLFLSLAYKFIGYMLRVGRKCLIYRTFSDRLTASKTSGSGRVKGQKFRLGSIPVHRSSLTAVLCSLSS